MKCRECETENPENADFCGKCGKPLSNMPKEAFKSPESPKKSNSKLLILIICIIAVIGIVTVIGVFGLISASPDTNSSGNTEYNVMVADTMEPAIYRGDLVKVDNNPTNIQVGDIIVYNATWFDEPVLHRVIASHKAKNGTTYFTAKGDNNPVPDPVPVYQNQIISKVVTSNGQPVVIPKVGYITLWIRGL